MVERRYSSMQSQPWHPTNVCCQLHIPAPFTCGAHWIQSQSGCCGQDGNLLPPYQESNLNSLISCSSHSSSFLHARGSVVVKALCYKLEGHGFQTRWGESSFSIYLILLAALDPGLHSASNRNEYQKQKHIVSGACYVDSFTSFTLLQSHLVASFTSLCPPYPS
jgi:hypothetical protein